MHSLMVIMNYDKINYDKIRALIMTKLEHNYDKIRASYGWNHLYEYLKCDDPVYYESITMKLYNKIKQDFE